MPMIDGSMFAAAGLPIGQKALKYSNTIDQHGNAVRPSKLGVNLKYESIYESLAIQDIREFIERYQWVNVPRGLKPALMERILYFRGKALLYYNKEVEKFQFLPYSLNKTIDEYGRYTRANTHPFIGVSSDDEGKSLITSDIEIVYDDLWLEAELGDPETIQRIKTEWESGDDKGIAIYDSSLILSQQPPIRAITAQPMLSSLATCYQIINTAMFSAADYNLINTQNESEYQSLQAQLGSINENILRGERFGAVLGTIKLESLRTTNASQLQDLWETFNSLDNFRKSTLGVANSGVFNKKERMLQQEQQLNGSNADDIYMNGLMERQTACLLFNQYYGANMWCMSKREPTNTEMGKNMQGDTDDYGTQEKEGTTMYQATEQEGGAQ